jgi:hypothetical protein
MAMTIFFALNGFGLAFLLYVLANFWKEGQRSSKTSRKYASEFGEPDGADVVVVTTPMSPNAWYAPAVIPFRPRSVDLSDRTESKPASRETCPVRVKRTSTR